MTRKLSPIWGFQNGTPTAMSIDPFDLCPLLGDLGDESPDDDSRHSSQNAKQTKMAASLPFRPRSTPSLNRTANVPSKTIQTRSSRPSHQIYNLSTLKYTKRPKYSVSIGKATLRGWLSFDEGTGAGGVHPAWAYTKLLALDELHKTY